MFGNLFTLFCPSQTKIMGVLFILVEYSYNTSFYIVAKTIPSCIVYGWDPPSLLMYEAGSSTFLEVD